MVRVGNRQQARAPSAMRPLACLTVCAVRAYMPVMRAGRMAEWLCRGLQILVQRFDSGSGLQGLRPRRRTPSSPVAQLVERAAVNRLVAGSSPARGANKIRGSDEYVRPSDLLFPQIPAASLPLALPAILRRLIVISAIPT